MSMMKRIFALLLTVAMLVCVLTACSKPTPFGKISSASSTANNADADTAAPQKITSVHITCGKSAIENYAAAELKWYFTQKGITLADNGYGIELKLDETIFTGGYQITANENGLVIAGGNERGLAYGLYAFLEKFVGVYFYSADTTVIDDNDVIIGTGVLDVFEPKFEIVRNPWYPIERLSKKDGGNDRDRITVKSFSLNTIVGDGSTPPCLTAPESINKAISKVSNYLWSTPGVDVLSFAPDSDADLYCTCESCSQIHNEEGSPAGTYIRFLNALAEAISSRFPKIRIELVVRAYLKTAPSLTKPTDKIAVRLSMEKCHISHPVTDESCPETVGFATVVSGWSAISNNVHVEYGLTSTTDFIPTFANFGTLRENVRFFAECGVDSISCSGNFACPSGEFGELRVYLVSKLLQNPMMSEAEYYGYMDSFLKAYYGEGWEYIRKFIDKTIELSADGHQAENGSPFDAITQEEYLENEATFDEWWNAAEALAGDRIDFVKHARYQWRYIKLCLHPNAEEAQKLIDDTSDSFNTRVGWREKQWNVDVEKSDLNLPPTEWVYKS